MLDSSVFACVKGLKYNQICLNMISILYKENQTKSQMFLYIIELYR